MFEFESVDNRHMHSQCDGWLSREHLREGLLSLVLGDVNRTSRGANDH